MKTFEIGAHVRVKDSEIDGFIKSFAKRIEGRVGVVRGYFYGNENHVLVTFPRAGRKHHFDAPYIHCRHLELVEDAA
ncbi:hypothetical protein [Burkholderia gladioli]|uniref:hypothetical protein n=1 Tax=Burkholderia gladioli TaxID=28095 RepID=UPI0011B24091|nr:hypothetical protein [Burkholderia gladioli]